MPVVDPSVSRRSFLKFLAGSPLLAWSGNAALAKRVERVLELVRTELEAAMRQCGARSVKELSPAFVRRA